MRNRFSAFGQMGFILKFITKFLWQTDKWSLVAAVVTNTFNSTLIIPDLYLGKVFFDTLVDNVKNPQPLQAFQIILWLVAARLGLQILRSLTNRIGGYYVRILFMKQNQKLEVMIGTKYATISVPTIENPEFRDRYQRVERESNGRFRSVTENFVRIPQYISGVVSALSIFVVTQPLVAFLSLISLIPALSVERIFIKKDFELDTETMKIHRVRGLYYFFLARARSYMELKLLNIHKYLGGKIKSAWQEIIDKRSSLYKSRRTWAFLAGIADDTVSYSFDALFAYQFIIGRITIGTAQAYIRAIANFKQNFSNLTAAVLELYENHLYLKDLVWFLNLDSPYYNNFGIKLTKNAKLQIKFEDVWFKYPQSQNWILKGVNLEIDAHQNVAIIGSNGVGKTTLVKLMCGFYSPQKGRVLIGNYDVKKLNKPRLWDQIAVLFQEFDAYNTSARESIGVGRIEKITDIASISKHAKMSDIDTWIKSLPKGYETPLSRDFEDGVIPSTGQWQRIGIARALFRDPKILVLDEPTSNVDPQAEEDVFNNLLKYGHEKTLVFISHRFSTVRRADRILLLEDGKITEQGGHDQLMDLNGQYAYLFNLQAKSYQ